MIELKDFYYNDFGWVCRQCELDSIRSGPCEAGRSRLIREGEAESKSPELSTRALAKWTDPSRQALICPHCGVVEIVEKS